jgi:hypothetical protein
LGIFWKLQSIWWIWTRTQTLLLSYDTWIFENEIYRICYRYEHYNINTMPYNYTMKQENTIFNDANFNANVKVKSLEVYNTWVKQ